MPFFLKNHTISELKNRLNTLSLEQLLQWNHSYGDEFVRLDGRQETTEAQLAVLKTELFEREEKFNLLLSTESQVQEEEKIRVDSLASLGGSRSEVYLLKTQLNSFSPLAHYNNSVFEQEERIADLKSKIAVMEGQIQGIKDDFSLTVQELRILNGIIEKLREAPIGGEKNDDSPSASRGSC